MNKILLSMPVFLAFCGLANACDDYNQVQVVRAASCGSVGFTGVSTGFSSVSTVAVASPFFVQRRVGFLAFNRVAFNHVGFNRVAVVRRVGVRRAAVRVNVRANVRRGRAGVGRGRGGRAVIRQRGVINRRRR